MVLSVITDYSYTYNEVSIHFWWNCEVNRCLIKPMEISHSELKQNYCHKALKHRTIDETKLYKGIGETKLINKRLKKYWTIKRNWNNHKIIIEFRNNWWNKTNSRTKNETKVNNSNQNNIFDQNLCSFDT